MKDIKLIPQEAITLAGPNIADLERMKNEHIKAYREDNKHATFTTLYAIVLTPIIIEFTEEPDVNSITKPKIKMGTPIVTI